MLLLIIIASLTVTITASGENTAGEHYSLTCTVEVVGSSDVPTITWITTEPEMMSQTSDDNSTHVRSNILSFTPLKESHANNYTCVVNVVDITVTKSYLLDVQSKF